MYFERLEVSSVRNLTGVAVDLSPGLNLFIGPNGAGKTSVLEGAYLLARGRSFRTARISQVIQHNAPALVVRAQVHDEHRGSFSVGVQRHRSNVTELRINGVTERRLSEAARLMPIQLMLPDSAALVFGEPALRRRFLDWGTFHVEHSYIDALRDYQRALRQRNAVLRAGQMEPARLAELPVWTDAVIQHGEAVTDARRSYLAGLQTRLPSVLAALSPGLEIEVVLDQGWADEHSLEESMSTSAPRDVKSGTTQQGPHRADLKLLVDGMPAATVLSRGQGKLAASALHLAQAGLTAAESGRTSAFLIDDLGAELDREHNQRFFQLLADMGSQVLATATAIPQLGGAFEGASRRMFHVEQGACRHDGP